MVKAVYRVRRVTNAGGMTLIELLVVLAIMGMLTAIAVPGYQSVIQNNYRSLAQQTLLGCASNLMEERTRLGSWRLLNSTLSDEEKAKLCVHRIPKDGALQYSLNLNVMDKGFLLTAKPESTLMKEDGRLTLNSKGLGCRIILGKSCDPW